MHGATGDKPTDTDIAGVYIQPVEMILGIDQKRSDDKWFDPDTHVWSTSGDNVRNTADDIDVALYSLRKWASMAATGHTTVLEFLFTKNTLGWANSTYVWETYILGNKDKFLSKAAGIKFGEYARAQLHAIKGVGKGKHGQRPELEAQYGYDTKAAMHMLRVLGEGIELMETGNITLPRPEAPFLKDVRNGKFALPDIEALFESRETLLEIAMEKSSLRDTIDRAEISRLITEAQLDFWGLK